MANGMTNLKATGADGRRPLAVNIITALFLLASVPAAFAIGTNEFDESWMYFLNYIRRDEYVFGRDIFFTYGPLGFLTAVREVRGSLVRGVALWLVIYGIFIFLMLQVRRVLLEKKISLVSASVAALLFMLPQKLSPDVLASFYVWLAVALLIDCGRDDRRGILFALAADILVAMLFLWKMSSFTSSLTVCIVAVVMLVFIRREYRKAFLLSLSLLFVPCAYLIYNPCGADLLRYCRAALQTSSGYNAALGNVMTTEPFTAFFVVFGVAAGICLAVQLWGRDRKSFALFLPLFIPLFFYYKYGITRHGGYAFYQGVCMAFSIYFLFGIFDYILFPDGAGRQGHLARRRLRLGRVSLAYVLALCILEFPAFLVSIPTMLKDSTLTMPSQIINNYLFSVRNGGRRSLNPRFREIVGDKSVAIFPDELFYLTDGSVQYKVMPTIQNNMTFTSWLDETNAAFFAGDGAPEFVLFGLESMDMRLPMLESPATYMAIRENYRVAASSDTEILFRRDKSAGPGRTEKTRLESTAWGGTAVSRPAGARYLSIEMQSTLAGKLAELFWKSLPVFVEITFDDGSVTSGRIVPRTAVTPIAVDDLVIPYSGVHPRGDGATEVLAQILTGKQGKKAVSVDFSMKGLLRLYYRDITVSWWGD